jgi:hypothetical protein
MAKYTEAGCKTSFPKPGCIASGTCLNLARPNITTVIRLANHSQTNSRQVDDRVDMCKTLESKRASPWIFSGTVVSQRSR